MAIENYAKLNNWSTADEMASTSDFDLACQPPKSEPSEGCSLDRVPDPLRKSKREAYDPQLLSLGPHHHARLNSLMIGRHFKIQCCQSLGTDALKRLKETLDKMLPQVQAFYGNVDNAGTAESMAMDSVFLLCFLDYVLHSNPESAVVVEGSVGGGSTSPGQKDLWRFEYVEGGLKCDVVMLENQLPLDVVKEAFAEAKQHFIQHHYESVEDMLSDAVLKLSPFAFHQAEIQMLRQSKSIAKQQQPAKEQTLPTARPPYHLLEMLQRRLEELVLVGDQPPDAASKSNCLCLWLRRLWYQADDAVALLMGLFIRHPVKRGNTDFVESYNAESLYKAGVRFRSFTKRGSRIYLDKQSATLYLPRVTMSHVYTEVLLRNVVALEFNDAAAKTRPVTSYVQLMDCLVDSADDVRLLRHAHVIVRDSVMLKDSHIAHMWNDMCRPFFSARMEPPDPLNKVLKEVLIKNFYKSKLRGLFKEFWETYFWRPWTAVAMLVGILLVAGDAIQTFCTISPLCKG